MIRCTCEVVSQVIIPRPDQSSGMGMRGLAKLAKEDMMHGMELISLDDSCCGLQGRRYPNLGRKWSQSELLKDNSWESNSKTNKKEKREKRKPRIQLSAALVTKRSDCTDSGGGQNQRKKGWKMENGNASATNSIIVARKGGKWSGLAPIIPVS